ncbi:enoyl-CoA hydratase/isomerase family protein [Clostridium boliviensis]|uniref:Enoyl-CoA hydratase/isomerase family protein n=1 Tax=Clostridium boliviensis TaxID=318465 RepID=A0ABU4GKC0_9CLOT|nr:enoyl-CoA hydratase/isomerase family protein [Clostridium boliviensis]MDW2798062.1 enoyl-CoA hydratase/isomerase family protein [Clostridium boliviensis]
MNRESAPMVEFDTVGEYIGVLRLHNGRDNLVDHAVFLDLPELKQWLHRNSFKGLIITGNGRNFSKGANVERIRAYKDCPKVLEKELNEGKKILSCIEDLRLITVAAIEGACFGAGLEIALSCNYRLAAESALLSFPEVTLGLLPGFGGTIRLPKLIGQRAAKKLILSGDMITGQEALRLGLVDETTGKKEAFSKAVELIEGLANRCSARQMEYFDHMMDQSGADCLPMYENESRYFAELLKTMDI